MRNYTGTFGGSLAALRLNEMMNQRQDAKLIRIVSKYINKFQKTVKEIYSIKDLQVRAEILQMYTKNFTNKIIALNLEKPIETHLLCHCSTYMKKIFNA